MRKISKICFCLSLIFLDVESSDNSASNNNLIYPVYSLLPNWSLAFTKAHTKPCPPQMNQGCYTVRPDPWDRDEWDNDEEWEDEDEDEDEDEWEGEEDNSDEVWSGPEIVNIVSNLTQVIAGLKEQLAVSGLPNNSPLRAEILRDIDILGKIVGYLNTTVQVTNHSLNKEFGYAAVEVAALLTGLGFAAAMASGPPAIVGLLSVFASGVVSTYGKDIYDSAKEYVKARVEDINSEIPYDPKDRLCYFMGIPALNCQSDRLFP